MHSKGQSNWFYLSIDSTKLGPRIHKVNGHWVLMILRFISGDFNRYRRNLCILLCAIKIDSPIILRNTSIALMIDFSTFFTLSMYFTNPAFYAIVDS